MPTDKNSKLPQWWQTLLSIFDLTNKQYWKIFLYSLGFYFLAFIIQWKIYENPFWYTYYNFPFELLLLIPFIPFSYGSLLIEKKKGNIFLNNPPSRRMMEIFYAMFSPFIFLFVLTRYFYYRFSKKR